MIVRTLQKSLSQSRKSVLLLGPRQVGKSTLLKSLKPELEIDLSDESQFLRFSSDPDLLKSLVEESSARRILIDEVQRLPSILNTAQFLIDQSKSHSRPLQFLLSGSSAVKLRRKSTNFLPGRVLQFYLSGLCAQELNGKINLKKAFRCGFLPEPYLESDLKLTEKLLSSYASIYVKEEIQTEALVRNIQGFARFLFVLAAAAGQVFDFSKASSKAKVSRTSSIRFVEVLEETLIAERVSVFDRAESADTIRHPKIYFFDIGVLNGLLGNFEASADRLGSLMEHVVYNQIRNSAIAFDHPIKISFFRTRHGLEVDFVVEHKGKVWAIEVKSGDVRPSDLEPLIAFRDYFPEVHRCMVVSPTETRKRVINGIGIGSIEWMLSEMGWLSPKSKS